MPNERLIPFAWDAFVADPMRVRSATVNDRRPILAMPALGCVAVHWAGWDTPTMYPKSKFDESLRLAAPEPQRVKVRLYRGSIGSLYAWVERDYELPNDTEWCSDIVEIEVKP